MSRSTSVLLRSVLAAVLAGLLASLPAYASDAKPHMSVRLHLLKRTYPHIVTSSPTVRPGHLLYPSCLDLTGTITWQGPDRFLETLSEKLEASGRDGGGLAEVLIVRVGRLVDGRTVPIPDASKRMRIEPIPLHSPAQEGHLQCRFRIPVALGDVWKEGSYQIEIGTWYVEDGNRRSIGVRPFPFEIKKFSRGGADEINLLTNAWLDYRILQQLVENKMYTAAETFSRTLALDPKDVWARHQLARKAILLEGRPQRAATLYESILEDIRGGGAHRIEALADPYTQIRSRGKPRRQEEWEAIVREKISEAKKAASLSQAARKRVDGLREKGDTKSLVAQFNTGEGGNLWSKGDVWPAFWAIRRVGEMRLQEARGPLLKELRKLPEVPGLFQVQIVSALASIDGNSRKAINRDVMTPEESLGILREWRGSDTNKTKQ